MNIKKAILLGLIAVLVIGLTVSCTSNKPANISQESDQGFIERTVLTILEGLTESFEEAREIQRRLTLEQQQAFLERHLEATATADTELQSVKEAQGVDAKLTQIWTNIREHTRTVQEREQARRAEINEQTSSVNPYARTRQEIQENNTN